MLDTSVAATWIERWDRQQETFLTDREERFQVIADVVETVADRPDPLVVDLGCGPGSLSARVLDRVPGAEVVGVDADPLLLGLAAAAYGHRRGLRFVDADLRRPGWTDVLALTRRVDAVVSTTALHWLHEDELAATFRAVAGLLRPGGVFVDGDHFYDAATTRLAALSRVVGDGVARRAGVVSDDTAWSTWWRDAEADPHLAELVASRAARPLEHGDNTVDYADNLRLLTNAGFAESGTVWQHGADRVLVAAVA
ncbi:MAG: class I SAM-dependent methyltransferase [Streptosporangiales bacterium]|nr:class I SAM-dependent methyltransferase [Streptosporangiales bacterium]MBO0892559.1 class I SAM-dependent methyltransferase [Acidothermales bacterium]